MVTTPQLEFEIERMRSQVATLQQLLALQEGAAAQQSQRLESILSSISDGFFVLDGNWRVTYLNPVAASTFAAMSTGPGDLLGCTLWSRFPHLEGSEFQINCRRAIDDREQTDFEVHFEALQACLECHAYPWEDGVSVFFQDVTARRAADRARELVQDELEKQVQLRTADLQATLAELEAFSYSVSHDLRAPLRSLDGFSQALIEDYSGKLEDDGKMYLERIRANAQKMAQLIDALLQLSRVTRAELNPAPIDLSAIAAQVAEDLRASAPRRDCEFVIEPGIFAEGDPKLIEVAFENLLQNAWKFSARREKARIEFGAILETGDGGSNLTCFVRDNGAGFDMKYRDKLFTAFQRLHDVRDYEGTGIGLATVGRIFKRHGGRIWAESSLNQGACFYFTLRGLQVNTSEEKTA